MHRKRANNHRFGGVTSDGSSGVLKEQIEKQSQSGRCAALQFFIASDMFFSWTLILLPPLSQRMLRENKRDTERD